MEFDKIIKIIKQMKYCELSSMQHEILRMMLMKTLNDIDNMLSSIDCNLKKRASNG